MPFGFELGGALAGAALGGLGGILGARDAKRARRRQRAAIESARQFADEAVGRITGGELFSSANEFLTSTFRDAAGSPLAQDFAKQIRAAQSVRGTFSGNIGAAQEAIGTSAAAQRLRQSLLPQAMQFAYAPEQFRQSILGFEAPLRVAAATGGQLAGVGPSNIVSSLSAGLGQALSGGLGGFQIGSALGQQSRQSRFLQEQAYRAQGILGPQQSGGNAFSGLGYNSDFLAQLLGGLG